MPARRRARATAVLTTLLLLVLAVVVLLSRDPAGTAPGAPGTALAALERLEVRDEASGAGYQRTRFGESWVDVDDNGCRTRDDVLQRDLTDVRLAADGCQVLSGELLDPYSGRRIDFVRGEGTSSAVQIDHVVALSDAWRTGAQELSDDERVRFANDPLELLAVDGPLNSAKGDSDASQWLPPQGHCAYAARQVAVKTAWRLWVTPAEHDALADVLADCPDEPLPAS